MKKLKIRVALATAGVLLALGASAYIDPPYPNCTKHACSDYVCGEWFY